MTRGELLVVLEGWLARLPIRRFREPAPVIAALRLHGVIGRVGPMSSGLTLERLEKSIDRAFSLRRVKTVVLLINSPGGSPVQSALIAGRIRQLANEKDIPVVAFTEDIAASGGYWLACAADEIYSDANSIVGSIGVISSGFGFPLVLDRIGIERRVHTAGKRKGMLDPFQAEVPEDIDRLKSIQVDMHENFKNYVRERRGDKISASDSEIFEGDIWTGGQALSLGLIDGLGDVRTVTRNLFGDRVKIRPVNPASGGKFRRWLGPASNQRESILWESISALEEWFHWKRFGL